MLEVIVGRRQGPRHHRPRHGHRRDRDPPRRRRRTRQRWLRQRLLPLHQRDGLQRHRRPGARTARAPTWPTPATRRSTRPASRSPATHQSKLTLMSESLRNDGRIWVPKKKADCDEGPARHPGGGPRLLPRADLPLLRQPGPPRHRLARRQERVRRGPRRRPGGRGRPPRRLPRLRRRDRAPGRGRHRGEVRQPLRHVRPDHRREPLRDPDADLPGRALRHGRPLGRLRPAVLDRGPLRHRRGQLLRPRRQPARRLGADAGPGRRLLRAAAHHPRLPRRRAVREDRRGPPGRRRGAAGGPGAGRPLPQHQRHPQRRLLPPRARQHHVGVLRHGAHRGRPQEGDRPDPHAQAATSGAT